MYLIHRAALLAVLLSKAVSRVGAEQRAAGVGVTHGVDVGSGGVGCGCREMTFIYRRHITLEQLHAVSVMVPWLVYFSCRTHTVIITMLLPTLVSIG